MTASTEWPAIVAGIVGVAGILATYFQNVAARKAASADLTKSLNAAAGNLATRINAENWLALQAEKQRVYSEFQGRLDDVFMVAIYLRDRATSDADPNVPFQPPSSYDRRHTELAETTAKRPVAPSVRDEEARVVARN